MVAEHAARQQKVSLQDRVCKSWFVSSFVGNTRFHWQWQRIDGRSNSPFFSTISETQKDGRERKGCKEVQGIQVLALA